MPMVRTILPHRVLLVAEYVLDTRAHPRARRVRRLLALRQRTIACGAPVDTALQALLLQARLDLDRAVGAVRPDLLAGVGEVEHIVQLLTVVHGRVRRIPFADQLVRLVHADMVLVAVEALVVLLRPARVRVLLRILGRLLLPSLRCLAGLDRLVLLLRVALLGHRHNRGVNDLAAARNVARGLEMLAEALEQLVDQPGLRQRLAKQPDRGGIRHRLLEFQIEKAHERQPVTQDRVIGLAAGVALALLGLRLRHRLDVSAEILPSHHLLDRLQRIALAADRLQPALIEKALLPHDSLAPSAHYRVRSPSQIRGDLARGIFRGALYSVAPKDGSVIGTFSRSQGIAPLLDKAEFDSTKFTWLGSVTDEVSLCVTRHDAPVKSFRELLVTPATFGGEGAGSD